MKKSNKKYCQGCEQDFVFSTANDESNYCSQLCESGKFKTAVRKLSK